MKILGIHIGHDSSAALIINGRIIADMAEERFTRIKHYCGLPIHSIQNCLDLAGLTIKDIDVIAIPSAGSFPELNFLLELDKNRQETRNIQGKMVEGLKKVIKSSIVKPPLYIKKFPIASSTQIIHVGHHLAHAASAYYTSGNYEKQLVITIDGMGDGISMGIWRGENGKITSLKQFSANASLGWFYSNVTEALGWWHGDGEGKTMGLAPYGDTEKAKGVLEPFYPKFNGGDLVEPHDFGIPYIWNEMGTCQWHFDDADKIYQLIPKYGREHIAAEAQRILEEQVGTIIYSWLERERTKNLSCAGGVFLNVKLNQRIWNSDKVILHHIYPNPGDSGLAVGAALYVYYHFNPNAPIYSLKHLYWGPEYSNDKIGEIIIGRNLPHKFEEDIVAVTSHLLAQNKIIGWFQGRMESGPRSLGARSILMSPLQANNKDIINSRVKFREAFRPFCPSILAEKSNYYLVNPRLENFMITSFDATIEKQNTIPAVVHVDGTLRPQTVESEVNPIYWKLIKAFGDITGEYVLLNTSFNVKGEPIICHPREAIRSFYDTGLDYLILGNYVLEKTQ